MRLLIIEDNADIVEALRDDLGEILSPEEITVCRSRDSASLALESHVFDYVLLDRKIPTQDDRLDAEVEHGEAIFQKLRAESPGTQICFLTGFATQGFLTGIIEKAENVDIWGGGKLMPLVNVVPKRKLDDIKPLVASVKKEIELNDEIEIIGLPPEKLMERRALRIFGRRNQAASIVVEELVGGLSGVSVLKVTFRDQHGAPHLLTAAKVGSKADIKKEIQNYTRDVVRLPNGRYAVHTGDVFAGAGPTAGVFYRLIAEYESLAALLARDPGTAAAVVPRLAIAEREWTEGRPQSARSVQEIRRALISDDDMQKVKSLLEGINWENFEQRKTQARMCSQHGDLHCGNVLVDSHGEPILIDFARVGESTASLDPITLELSPIFHPGSRIVTDSWPKVLNAEHWDDVEAFTNGCPASGFMKAARQWAREVAAGPRETYATAYAFAARQLQFPDTDKHLARAILVSAMNAFLST
jgi:CheY-like chemotaxis protein